MIDINTSDPSIVYVTKTDTYGGRRFDLIFTSEVRDMIDWYRQHRDQLARESRAREQFQSVAAAYEQYQTTLKLVLDQV